MTFIDIESTFLMRDESLPRWPAYPGCERQRDADTAEVNAMLEAEFGPANRPDDKWENGINLWRENKLNAIAIECRKFLLKIHRDGDATHLSKFEMHKLGWCLQEVSARFYPTNSNQEIVADLVPRAVKMTDIENRAAAIKILRQRKWWYYQ